jgi:hypothetical protein
MQAKLQQGIMAWRIMLIHCQNQSPRHNKEDCHSER